MVVGVEQTTIYICENRDDQVHPESPSFLLNSYCGVLVLTDYLDTAQQEEHKHRRTQDTGWDWGILL